jgi:YidC/Oxa1 family membrane protein insertase
MDNIRFLLIIAFGFLVVLLWESWQRDYGPKSMAAVTSSAPAVPLATNHEDLPTAEAAVATQTADTAQNGLSAPITTMPPSKVISVKTDVIALEIDLQGGSIQNLDLLNYPEEKDNVIVDKVRAMLGLSPIVKNSAPIRVLNGKLERIFIAQSGLIAGAGVPAGPDHHSNFSSQQVAYVLESGQESLRVPLSWTDNNGLVVNKTFIFKPGSYEIGLEQSVKNDASTPWSARQYSQFLKLPFKEEKSGGMLTGMRAYDGGVIYTDKEKYQKIDFDDMVEKNLDVATQGGWTAMIQHYFASAWIPPADQENHFYTKYLKDGQYVIGSYSAPVTVAVGSTGNFASKLFVGPKIQPLMEKAAPGLELTVDYGVLTFIGKPIYSLLNKIHNLTGNWGFSIIGVTMCIKLLLFPLTQSSFRSMANMRKVQPRLKELQERFADDRPRFNTEMMALYKKEKVNPLGGCFPILFQIPVFMSLYWVLGETVEFRHAPFMLWIQDLSSQDPFYILPVIMGITMKIQQGLNPAPVDPVQAKIMKMFPLVFTIFFLFFPAGLVLYWVINNTLSITQQTYITKQINKTA